MEAFALCSSTHGAMWPLAHCSVQLFPFKELGSACVPDPAGHFVSSVEVCLLWSVCHGSADRLLVQPVCVVMLSVSMVLRLSPCFAGLLVGYEPQLQCTS